ncbi:hypothetical protein EMIHUDRAFT_443287 [Emiliania huxleyi CCMP1516]|uniref:BSD domain-containing protein n=2 Tax=Emiliania huxleyi TaxID=2903 RepID=A0A0D3JTZ4_EMIH1|nr:hypothetical protein EMIHUDRAFT_443287 [Emiliania huxleyi CCMP1516]EOD26979.1 hypothetical protein EMIHUDRAFT_443287 [Emiliania huxleyi CCMP1516]|eukprot:XP_005779408.1 hypothetical protein EMIHUDRAFT_443287 [Emiliania huxleyi CCMP1516]
MSSAGTLCKELTARLASIESTSALVADLHLLSSSDAAFLQPSTAASPAFAAAWPEEQQLDEEGMSEPFLALAAAALEADARVQKRCGRLVPKKLSEATFWRNYSSALHAVLFPQEPAVPAAGAGGDAAAAAESAADAAAEAMTKLRLSPSGEGGEGGAAALPAPSFARAAGDLQSSGSLSREKVLRFATGIAAVLMSDGTIDYLASLPPEAMPARCIALQREYLEHCGIEQEHGCKQLSQVPQRFGGDREVLAAFQEFVKACQNSAQAAFLRRASAPSADQGARFPPAGGELLSSGPLSRELLLRFLAGVSSALLSGDAVADLASLPPEAMPARCVALQRQYLEHCGIEQEHGCAELAKVPQQFGGDSEVLGAFRGFQQACRGAVQSAIMTRARGGGGMGGGGGGGGGLRFREGARVECLIGHEWRDGVVVATNFTPPAESGAPEGWVAPYQVKLATGELVLAPFDEEAIIREHGAASRVDPSLPPPRYAVGTKVACRMRPGDPGEWADGTVVGHHYRPPGVPRHALVAPYQIKLESGELIFAPADNDDTIRKR